MTYYILSCCVIFAIMLVALFVAFKHINTIWRSKDWIFIPILLLSVVTEIVATSYVWIFRKSAATILDVYTLIVMLMTIYWFYGYIKNKVLAIGAGFIMILSYVISYRVMPASNFELNAPIICAAVIITVYVFIFFNELLNKNKITDYSNYRPFWLAIGLFIFHVNTMPYLLFLPNVSRLSWQASLCIGFINLLMYGCFAYGLRLKNRLNAL